MSKHKKRDRDKNQEGGNNQFGFNMNNNPFGIDPTQLMSLLGNMDMGRVNNMLNTMNKNGFDINSANNMINNNFENINNMNSQNSQINNTAEMAAVKNGKFDINTLNSLAEKLGVGTNKIDFNNSEKIYHDKNNKKQDSQEENTNLEREENLQLLLSIRNIVDTNKKPFIDIIIKKYKSGELD